MAASVTHTTVATGPNDPTKQVSSDAWNAGHTISGLGTAAEADTGDFAAAVHTHDWADVTGEPTTATGYGIVSIDAVPVGVTTPSSGSFTTITTNNWIHAAATLYIDGGSGQARLYNAGAFTWSSTGSAIAAADTGISRLSAALVGIGNGTNGSFAGSMKLTDITSTGRIYAAPGSAADPAYSFAAATGMGISNVGGNLTFSTNNTRRMHVGSGAFEVDGAHAIGWMSNTYLYRDAAGIIAQRNGVNAQSFRVYYSYTDASNYARAAINTSATAVTLAAETVGSGADDIDVVLSPAGVGLAKVGANTIATLANRLEQFAAATDVTTLDASTSAHGLMQKYPGGTATFLRSDGAFAAPTAAASISQTEIDFGADGVSEASFVITDAAVSAASKLIGTVAYVAPTGKDLDELEMDQLDLKFAPGSGAFTLYATALNECLVHGAFKINYQVGA